MTKFSGTNLRRPCKTIAKIKRGLGIKMTSKIEGWSNRQKDISWGYAFAHLLPFVWLYYAITRRTITPFLYQTCGAFVIGFTIGMVSGIINPNIEDKNFTMNDIKFEIDNIHINQTISTYIKFGRSFGITLSSSTSNYGNISYMTSITGASAQGGNAPVAFVNDLLREKRPKCKYKNDNSEYPRTIQEFMKPELFPKVKYTQKHYETWFNDVKKYLL